MKYILFLLMLLPCLVHAQSIKILTWNVFMLPKPIKFTLQTERTPLIVKEILGSEADVIFLQEAFQGTFQKAVFKKTRHLYPHHFYLGRQSGTTTVYGSGVYVLSRFPMKVMNKVYFRDCTKADCFASKGSYLVEITSPNGKKAQFASTHLQSGHTELSAGIRFKQLQEINAILTLGTQNGVPQFLLGDLNIDGIRGSEFKPALTYLNMTSTPLEGDLGYTNGFPITCYSKPGNDDKEWIDHIWMNPMSSDAKVLNKRVRPFHAILKGEDCPLSDHYAVEATIKL